METYGGFVAFTLPVAFALAVFMVFIAILQDSKVEGKGQSIRRAFFGVLAMVALVVSVAGMVNLGYLGLKTWVFPDAQFSTYANMLPPSPAYPSVVPTDAKIAETQSTLAACTSETTMCPIKAEDMSSWDQWATEVRNWQATSSSVRREVIDSLSFLIPALPIFALFYILFQREKNPNHHSAVRPVYFYGLAFIALAVCVGGAALLVNAGLKTVLLPETVQQQTNYITKDDVYMNQQKLTIERLVGCQDVCTLSADVKSAAAKWLTAYDAAAQRKTYNQYHGVYASALPIIILGLPIFGYHFWVARREGHKETMS